MDRQKVEPYSWYLKRSIHIFGSGFIIDQSILMFDAFKDFLYYCKEMLICFICILIFLLIYCTFPISFPIIAYWARQKDIKMQARYDKRKKAMFSQTQKVKK